MPAHYILHYGNNVRIIDSTNPILQTPFFTGQLTESSFDEALKTDPVNIFLQEVDDMTLSGLTNLIALFHLDKPRSDGMLIRARNFSLFTKNTKDIAPELKALIDAARYILHPDIFDTFCEQFIMHEMRNPNGLSMSDFLYAGFSLRALHSIYSEKITANIALIYNYDPKDIFHLGLKFNVLVESEKLRALKYNNRDFAQRLLDVGYQVEELIDQGFNSSDFVNTTLPNAKKYLSAASCRLSKQIIIEAALYTGENSDAHFEESLKVLTKHFCTQVILNFVKQFRSAILEHFTLNEIAVHCDETVKNKAVLYYYSLQEGRPNKDFVTCIKDLTVFGFDCLKSISRLIKKLPDDFNLLLYLTYAPDKISSHEDSMTSSLDTLSSSDTDAVASYPFPSFDEITSEAIYREIYDEMRSRHGHLAQQYEMEEYYLLKFLEKYSDSEAVTAGFPPTIFCKVMHQSYKPDDLFDLYKGEFPPFQVVKAINNEYGVQFLQQTKKITKSDIYNQLMKDIFTSFGGNTKYFSKYLFLPGSNRHGKINKHVKPMHNIFSELLYFDFSIDEVIKFLVNLFENLIGLYNEETDIKRYNCNDVTGPEILRDFFNIFLYKNTADNSEKYKNLLLKLRTIFIDSIQITCKINNVVFRINSRIPTPLKLDKSKFTSEFLCHFINDYPISLTPTGPQLLSAADLIAARCSVKKMIESTRCTLENLRELGVSAAQIRRETDFSAEIMKLAGYSAAELIESGYSVEQLVDAKFDTYALIQAGVSTKILYELGVNVLPFVSVKEAVAYYGDSVQTLIQLLSLPAHPRAPELVVAGFSYATMEEAYTKYPHMKNRDEISPTRLSQFCQGQVKFFRREASQKDTNSQAMVDNKNITVPHNLGYVDMA